MAIEVTREKTGDTSEGRCQPESGRVLLESALQGGLHAICLQASAWLERSAGRKRDIPMGQMSARVGKGLIGIRSLRGIE